MTATTNTDKIPSFPVHLTLPTMDAHVSASPTDTTIAATDPLPFWKAPLHVGPMRVEASLPFGGGRGCVANRNLAPGTLVLVEEPLVAWSMDDHHPLDLNLDAIRWLFEHNQASEIVQAMEHFHPTKEAVDEIEVTLPGSDTAAEEQVEKMMHTMRLLYSEDSAMPLLMAIAAKRSLQNSNGSMIKENDIFRLLLAIRYNGLESGIYLYSAMLNHADLPNCVKFLPDVTTAASKEIMGISSCCSEVRTIRPVAKDEALTISYLPRIMSHASRRKYLWAQHRFDIGPEIPSAMLRKMECVGGQNQLPASDIHKWDDNSITHRIEQTTFDLDVIYKETLSMSFTGDLTEQSEQTKALEQASLELCNGAQMQLQNNKHVLLIACFRLHVESCELVQRDPSLSRTDRLKLLTRQIVSTMRLVELQILLFGPDHFDIARTDLDLAQAIEEMLTLSPKHLLSLQMDGMDSINAWAALEHKITKDHQRIKALYPRDVGKLLSVGKCAQSEKQN